MTKTYLTAVSNGTRDAECLQAFTDSGSGISGTTCSLLDRDSSAYRVSPACVLKTDRLDALYQIVNIQSGILRDLLCILDRSNTLLTEDLVDLVDSSFI